MLLGIFALGAVTGAVGHSLYSSHVNPPESRRPHRDTVEELARDIPLDAAQKEQLRTIVGKSRARFQDLRQQIRNQGRDEIRGILRDDQHARFEEIMREWDRRRKDLEKRSRPQSP
jgi:hypothetical protein